MPGVFPDAAGRQVLAQVEEPGERGGAAGARGGVALELRSLTNGLPSRTNVCTRRKRTCGPQGGSPGSTRTGLHATDELLTPLPADAGNGTTGDLY